MEGGGRGLPISKVLVCPPAKIRTGGVKNEVLTLQQPDWCKSEGARADLLKVTGFPFL